MISGVHKAGHDGVEEGGVAADGDHLLVQAVVGQLAQGLRQVDAGAHAVAGLEGILAGGLAGHDVAADVADDDAGVLLLPQHLLQNVESGAVGAAGAEGQLPLDQRLLRGDLLLRQLGASQEGDGLGHIVGVQLADLRQRAVAAAGEHNAHLMAAGDGLQVVLQNRVHFLQGQYLLHTLQMAHDGLLRQGPDGGQAQHADAVAHTQTADGLLTVQAAGAAGDDQLLGMLGADIVVEGAVFSFLPQHIQLFQHGAAQIGHAHHAVPLAHLLQLVGLFRQLAQHHVAAAMADTGGQPHDDDLVRALGELESVGNDVLGLLHAGGLQHGDVGGHGLITGVKFIGAGVRAGVVRGHDHHAALHAVLCAAMNGVRREEKAVLLHDADGPRVGQRGADAGFHGAGLVCGPLRVKVSFLRDFTQHSQDLGRRRTGIGGRKIDACFQCAAYDGLVALHQADLARGVGGHCPFHFLSHPLL